MHNSNYEKNNVYFAETPRLVYNNKIIPNNNMILLYYTAQVYIYIYIYIYNDNTVSIGYTAFPSLLCRKRRTYYKYNGI